MNILLETGALGGKGENLERLSELGLPVPSCFILPASVMEQMTADLELAGIFDDSSELEEPSLLASSRILALEWPLDLKEAIAERCASFGSPVAVRSSAVGEDGKDHSFAGQFDTFLFVRGQEEILQAIKRCWASAYSVRAVAYRRVHGLPHDVRMAVVIQKMIDSEISGVLFTADPLTGNRDKVILSSLWGLGEGLVSGTLDADTFEVSRRSGIIEPTLVEKKQRFVPAPEGGTKITAVPIDRISRESLSVDQIRRLVALGEKIEAAFGAPQDIEWTIEGEEIFLLQTRPITKLPPAPPEGMKRLFDNANIVESYSGITTPLTFSFASHGYEMLYRRLAEALGAHPLDLAENDHRFKNMLGLIRGRIYYNLGNWYDLMAFLPGYPTLKRFFSQSIGTSEQGGVVKAEGGRRGIAWLFFSVLRHYLSWDRDINAFRKRFNAVFEPARLKNFSSMRVDELADYYLEFFDRTVFPLWGAPIVNEFFTMLFYGLLKHTLTAWGLDDSASIQNDLLCGEGGIESVEPTKAIKRLALEVKGNPTLSDRLASAPPSEWMALSNDFPAFRAQVDDYIARYGFRCIGELKLESIPVTEDPTFLFEMLKNYLKLSVEELQDSEKAEAEERAIRKKAETSLRAKLGKHPLRKLLFGWVLKNARRGVKNRENMRFARTKVFGIVRMIFQEIGKQLVRSSHLDQSRDVLYLTVEEILAWVNGRSVFIDLRSLVELRKKEFQRFEKEKDDEDDEDFSSFSAPADRFETFGAVNLNNRFEATEMTSIVFEPGMLRGTSCCPGVIRGRARVIRPGDPLDLNGEILVAERTDPGWVPLYPSISGLLVERGSVLSHASIVAREMGIPTIVGIQGLMEKVSNGQFLEMDARAGVVHLDRES